MEDKINKGNISNPSGYLLKAFQNDYRPVETEFTKEQQKELARKQTEEASKKKLLHKEDEQRRSFEKWRLETIQVRLAEH